MSMKEGSRASFEQERIRDSSFSKRKMLCPECVVALCLAASHAFSGEPESLVPFARVSGSPRCGVRHSMSSPNVCIDSSGCEDWYSPDPVVRYSSLVSSVFPGRQDNHSGRGRAEADWL